MNLIIPINEELINYLVIVLTFLWTAWQEARHRHNFPEAKKIRK